MEEEKQSEAIEETKVEEDINPTPYKNPNRNLMDKAEDETETATEDPNLSLIHI